jgi:hypothetical protein
VENCLKILRVENGSIQDLGDVLISMVGQRRIPAGSIILVLSVAHLGNVGLEAYIADHLALEQKIKTKLGRDTKVGILPPLLLGCCTSPATVRFLYEFLAWAEDYYQGADWFLDKTFAAAAAALKDTGEGQQLNMETRRTRLSCHFKMPGEQRIWCS